MVSANVWESNIGDELDFWRDTIARKAQESQRPHVHDFGWLRAELGESFGVGDRLRILDVGSGPFSTLGVPDQTCNVDAVATDALGLHYNRMMQEAGLAMFPRILAAKGEDLSMHFGIDGFHWVNCANALDHFEDPAAAFLEMLRICKVKGCVSIISVENEGEREGYSGLHQWNLKATDEGLLLASRAGQVNLTAPHGDSIRYRWEYVMTYRRFRTF